MRMQVNDYHAIANHYVTIHKITQRKTGMCNGGIENDKKKYGILCTFIC